MLFGFKNLVNFKDAKIPQKVVGASRVTKKIASDYKGLFKVFTGVSVDASEVSIIVVDNGIHYYGGRLVFIACCIVLLIVMIAVCKKITRSFIDP